MASERSHVWITDKNYAAADYHRSAAVCQVCGIRADEHGPVGMECPGPKEKRKLAIDCCATGYAVLDNSLAQASAFGVTLDSIGPTALAAKDHALRKRGIHAPTNLVEKLFDDFLLDCKLVEVRISYTPSGDES